MDNNLSSQVDLIREVFHYQNRFERSTMVFKIDYPVTENPSFPSLVKDLALLAKTGFKIIIVSGVKENIDSVLKEHDIDSEYTASGGIPVRLTTEEAIPFVEMAAFNAASRFMTQLGSSVGREYRVEAVIGNFVRARGLGIIKGVDTEHTGTVDKIYADSLGRLLDLGIIPILPCIGWSPSGKPYNVPSDEIALAVSTALNASKLFVLSVNDRLHLDNFNITNPQENPNQASLLKRLLHIAESSSLEKPEISNQASLLKRLIHIAEQSEKQDINDPSFREKLEVRPDGSIIRLTLQQAEALISGFGENPGETAGRQKLRELKLALRASRAGIPRVHIIDGREEGAVMKELFSNIGVGTMLYIDEYDSIRAMHSRDLPDILRLMEPLMQKNILVRRNSEQIQEKRNDYFVLEIDGSIRACGALHDWGENQGEIAAIATDAQYSDLGLGRKIVGFLIEKARKNKMKRVFVLTTQTQDWFEFLGFKEAHVDSLPEQKRKIYDKNRKSKVFALEL